MRAAQRGRAQRGRARHGRARQGDAGAGTVLALGVAAVVMVAVITVATMAGLVVRQAAAQGAADGAALAGAIEARARQARAEPASPAQVCAVAAEAAARAGGILHGCHVSMDGDVTVSVARDGREAAARAGRLSAAARAEGIRTAADVIPESGRLRDRAAVRKSSAAPRGAYAPIQYGPRHLCHHLDGHFVAFRREM